MCFLRIFLFFSSFYFNSILCERYIAAGHVYCTTTGTDGAPPETPAKGVKIGLWEQDGDVLPGDVLMGDTVSNDQQGEFSVTGSTKGIGEEEIYLFLKHRCRPDITLSHPNETCYYTAKVILFDVLGDDDQTEVHNLTIYLGKNAASSDNKRLPVKSDWDWASHCD